MYLCVPLFSLQGFNGKREGGALLPLLLGLKTINKKNQVRAVSAFSHKKKHIRYIVAQF